MPVSVIRGTIDHTPASIKRELKPYGVAVLTLDPGMTISVDRQLWSLIETIGYKPEIAHSVAVQAQAVVHIATSPDPLKFSGRLIVAPDHIREHQILSKANVSGSRNRNPRCGFTPEAAELALKSPVS